jgi:uncharacterized membrane protein
MSPALRDWLVKTFWTALSAVLGALVIALTDSPWAYAPVAIAVVNGLLIIVRQKATGDVPPPAESRPSAA